MSAEQHTQIVQRLFDEFINGGDVAVASEVFAPDFVEHEPLPIPGTGRDTVVQFFTLMRAAFPDLRATVEDLIVSGDKVVARVTMRGTQQGPFLGIPPTGKAVTMPVIDILRVANGQIVEHWGVSDNLSLMQQLGAIPGPEQASH